MLFAWFFGFGNSSLHLWRSKLFLSLLGILSRSPRQVFLFDKLAGLAVTTRSMEETPGHTVVASRGQDKPKEKSWSSKLTAVSPYHWMTYSRVRFSRSVLVLVNALLHGFDGIRHAGHSEHAASQHERGHCLHGQQHGAHRPTTTASSSSCSCFGELHRHISASSRTSQFASCQRNIQSSRPRTRLQIEFLHITLSDTPGASSVRYLISFASFHLLIGFVL